MDNEIIGQLSETINNFNINQFVSDVDRCIQAWNAPDSDKKTDEKLSFFKKLGFSRKPRFPLEKEKEKDGILRFAQNDIAEAIERESDAICSRAALLLKYLGEFRFVRNGHPESDEKILPYFRKIKQQQQTLVSEISDETEMIRNIIMQSEQMRNLVKSHSERLQQTAFMLGIIQERLARRSSAMPVLLLPSDKNEIKNTHPAYHDDLFKDSCNEIEQRKQKIIAGVRELKDGWNLLEKLLKKGCGRSMRKKLDMLMNRHDLRVSEFQKQVAECRERYGFTAAEF